MKLPWRRRAEPELRVLMVCMGNICRSPTAEAVLRHKLAQAGLADRIGVDSAGTYSGHAGSPPDPRMQRHAAQRGYDLSGLRARVFAADDFARHGLILAMDDDNLVALSRQQPVSAPPPRLLMSFAQRPDAPREVPDPYYSGPDGFERVLDLVEDACDGLLVFLQSGQGNFRA
jgi:protein-tyrosine phosphatase